MTHLGEHITDFVFGELPVAEMEEARRHVAACEECRKQVGQFEHTRSMLKMSPDVEPPHRIVFEFEKPRTVNIWRWLIPAAVAAAVVLAVLLVLPLSMQWHDSQLTIAFGTIPSKPAVPQPIVSPQPVVQPVAQQVEVDYGRIQALIDSEVRKRSTDQTKEMQQLQGQLVYLEGLYGATARESAETASAIQLLVPKSGAQE